MANCQLPPPDAMVCTGSVAENWKVFKEAYNDFTTATQLTKKDDEIQADIKDCHGKRVPANPFMLRTQQRRQEKTEQDPRKARGIFCTHQKCFVRAIPISLGTTTA